MSSSRFNFDHFAPRSPAFAFDQIPSVPRRASRNDGGPNGSGRRLVVRRLLLRSIFSLYEIWLHHQVCLQPAPRHVGIILDGNRRYARTRGVIDPQEIYALGARKLDDVLEWCGELRIPAITLWAVSTDNLSRRPATEVSGILAALEAKLATLAQDPRIHQQRVRVKAAGRTRNAADFNCCSDSCRRRGNRKLQRRFNRDDCCCLRGHDEITDAVRALLREAMTEGKALAETVEAVTPAGIARHLYMAGLPDPDLIIRTSGENRLSGFLLWQSAYSEL